MGKLHEVLAVVDALQGQVKSVLEEGKNTLGNKEGLFAGVISETKAFAVSDEALAQDFRDNVEVKAVVETVPGKINFMRTFLERHLDAELQKDQANQLAVASIVVDGNTIATNIPAVTLLTIEHKLRAFRDVVSAAKTFDTSQTWTPDPAIPHVYQSTVSRKVVKMAREDAEVVVQQSDKHPAQWRTVKREIPVAERLTRTLTGLVSPLAKHQLLERIDTLIAAVKQARQRANEVSVPVNMVGKQLFDFIVTGL